jgi:hypothetical protein
VYHNGAESYYAARGFRGSLRVWLESIKVCTDYRMYNFIFW